MELSRYLERNVARHEALTERFYYRPEQRVSELARSLGVDRNTILRDVELLAVQLDPYVERCERGRGAVTLRFARASPLLELSQHAFRASNLLLLLNEYLTRPVDIAAFAARRGLSVSAAYALNRRAVALLARMGGTCSHGVLEADELTLRYIAILVRSALGFRPPVLNAPLASVNRLIDEFGTTFGVALTDLDRSFLRAAVGLSLERGDRQISQGFLDTVAEIPAQEFFAQALVDGRSFARDEARFLAAMAACVTAKNHVAPDDELAQWVERDPTYGDLRAHMEELFGRTVCATELFGAALRRLYLFIRIGAAATAFTQDRPIPAEHRDLLAACREIVEAWAGTLAGPRTPRADDDLIVQFVLQILPLVNREPAPRPIYCVVVTQSELNRLTLSAAIEQGLPGIARVAPIAYTSVGAALTALDQHLAAAHRGTDAGAAAPLGVIVVDREYPDVEAPRNADSPAATLPYPLITTSIVERTSSLTERLRTLA